MGIREKEKERKRGREDKNSGSGNENEKEMVEFMDGPILLDASMIRVNKYQPRKVFNEKEIEELANSIKENGLIQPLIVSKTNDKGNPPPKPTSIITPDLLIASRKIFEPEKFPFSFL
ncbi:MAG: ParB N-terminal domain-containing protein [Oligoflexia bacterium]|nr:ParB N-terminal domain-containing protein [Oligoflexia bacterium]